MEKRAFLNSPVLEEDMQDIYARGLDWQKLRGKTVLLTGATECSRLTSRSSSSI